MKHGWEEGGRGTKESAWTQVFLATDGTRMKHGWESAWRQVFLAADETQMERRHIQRLTTEHTEKSFVFLRVLRVSVVKKRNGQRQCFREALNCFRMEMPVN
jgi:hypothetical protein